MDWLLCARLRMELLEDEFRADGKLSPSFFLFWVRSGGAGVCGYYNTFVHMPPSASPLRQQKPKLNDSIVLPRFRYSRRG